MNWIIPRPRQGARLVASLLVASAVSLGSVASASAQTVNTEAGKAPVRGVTLEQALGAAQAISGPAKGAAIERSATLSSGGVIAVFIAPVQDLVVIGTAQDDTITVSRTDAGTLLVNGGAVPILGQTPTVANTSLIEIFGLDGNDKLSLNEAHGPLPDANLFGGAGDDILTGGSGADELFGEAGNDTLFGKGGNDFLFGGAGNDVLVGGAGNDQSFGEAGDDKIIWNPGDGSDLNEGGDGNDTIEVNGGNAAEVFTVVPNGTRVRFDRTSPAPFFLDIGTAENLVVNMNGGDDTFTASNGLAPLIALTVDGGPGNDTITGGDGNDVLIGGDGNDTITGGRGNDVVLMGAGDDTFVWNPGDGSDTVEGQGGTDTMIFNGSNANEKFDFSANGSRLRLFRDVGNIVMDTNGVERVVLNELGGTDQTTVNDLSGTSVAAITLGLAAQLGGTTGDNLSDTVIVNATSGNDVVNVSGVAGSGSATVDGLATKVTITAADATDALLVNGLAGDDVLDASALGVGTIALTLDGGDGDDVLVGGAGDDHLLGGAGDDVLIGGPGFDVLDGGTGNNILIQ